MALLEEELSYKIRGCIYKVANKYGKGLKENVYQKAMAEEFALARLNFIGQKRIDIYSFDTGKNLGVYVPDFVIEDKIIVELKSSNFTIQKDIEQQRSYLRISKYEIAYLAVQEFQFLCVIPNAACGGGIPWRERWTGYSALIQGIPRRFAPRDDARTMCRRLNLKSLFSVGVSLYSSHIPYLSQVFRHRFLQFRFLLIRQYHILVLFYQDEAGLFPEAAVLS